MASSLPTNQARFTRAELIEATGGSCDPFEGEVSSIVTDTRVGTSVLLAVAAVQGLERHIECGTDVAPGRAGTACVSNAGREELRNNVTDTGREPRALERVARRRELRDAELERISSRVVSPLRHR